LNIIPLDGGIHNRRNFDCGEPSLNKFLQEQAQQAARRFGSKTVVLVDDDANADPTIILGYHTTLIAHVDPAAIPEGKFGKELVPMLLLARIAIDRRFQGKGLGSFLLMDVLKKAKAIADATALFGVFLDALGDDVEKFYLKYGFKALTDKPRHLYMPIGPIVEMVKRHQAMMKESAATETPPPQES
jgi:GNAT superfamily N-acetyltransferase